MLKRDFFHGGGIVLNGKPVRHRTPRPAIQDGIVYVTEDRKLEGFFETMSIAEAIHLGALAVGRNPLSTVSLSEARAMAKDWTDRLAVKAIDPNARIIELSGGNRQKVVIAEASIQKPKPMILDEPTRGVDVGAIVEIHTFIEALADSGIAVVMISSCLSEIMAQSDRILITKQGRIVEAMDLAWAAPQSAAIGSASSRTMSSIPGKAAG